MDLVEYFAIGVDHFSSLEDFNSALNKLYVFTSDADGIRHAGLKPSEVDQALAKFMLTSCSEFVNYLRSKQEVVCVEALEFYSLSSQFFYTP